MNSIKELAYCTENHDYTVQFDGSKATINCKWDKETEAFENPVTLIEFKQMIETIHIKGIKHIYFNCNYSVELKRNQWQEIAKKQGVKITRISN